MSTTAEKTSLIKVGEEVQKVKEFFNTPAIKEGLQRALPQAGVSFERLMSTLVSCVHKNPGLLLCERGSLFQSIVRAAQMGLEIDSPLGHAYLIPFKQQVQLIIGYKGLITLAYRDPHLVSLYAHVVGKHDDFDYELGSKPFIHHRPDLTQWTLDPETLVAVYAVAKLRNGGEIIEVVPGGVIEQLCTDQLAKHEGKGVWRNHFGAQARKTAIRRISNHLPKSAEDSARQWYEALEHERRTEVGQVTDAVEMPESPELSEPFIEDSKAVPEPTVWDADSVETIPLTVYFFVGKIEGEEVLCITGSDSSLAAIRNVLTRKKDGLAAKYKPLIQQGKLVKIRFFAKPTHENLSLLLKTCADSRVKLVEEFPELDAKGIGFGEKPKDEVA
jgi:recombination protein RecT